MIGIHWFRKGLRLKDNPALKVAIQKSELLLPIVILDPFFFDPSKISNNRMDMFLQTLNDLDIQLKENNLRLVIFYGKPLEVFQKLIDRFDIKILTFEKDTEPYSLERDRLVQQLFEDYKIECVQEWGHTLYNLDDLFVKNKFE